MQQKRSAASIRASSPVSATPSIEGRASQPSDNVRCVGDLSIATARQASFAFDPLPKLFQIEIDL